VGIRTKRPTRLATVLVWACLLAVGLAVSGPAGAAAAVSSPHTANTPSSHLSEGDAIRIAGQTPQVAAASKRYHGLAPEASLSGGTRWEVTYFAASDAKVQVVVDDSTAAVLEVWTGPQAGWQMARGYPGAFGRNSNALYVWLPLCALFALPFIDWRRPFRLLHLDIAVLLAFSVSLAFFNKGEIFESVPLVYPALVYLLARMLVRGFRPRQRMERLIPTVPTAWLCLALLFLVGFRVALNVTDSNVIDVGYAGVIGADRIAHGSHLYGTFPADNAHGDTYGPINYLAYVPFERVFGWSGQWDALPAAHAAAIAFDLLTIAGLVILGRQLSRSSSNAEDVWQRNRMGILLGFAWASYPFSLFVLACNANDSLVAMLLVYALVALRSTAGRSFLTALAAGAKFAPLALAPLFATGTSASRRRSWLVFGGVFAAVVCAYALPFVVGTGPTKFYKETLGFQADRHSPFSIWGLVPSLGFLRIGLIAVTFGFASLLAVFPRRRSLVQVAALAAAVLLAVQLSMSHWFYLYIVWFAPLVFVALFSAYPDAGDAEQTPRAARYTTSSDATHRSVMGPRRQSIGERARRALLRLT
jgi:hypothetical protein